MFDIKGFFKRRQEGKLEEARRAHEQVRLAFTQRYLNFKTLLSLNDKVLEIITTMEQALEGEGRFGMAFVRSQCTALSVNLFRIIQSLNAISEERYRNLYPVFDRIWNRIDEELKKKKPLERREWVLSLQDVDKSLYDLAGNKMANLGEIRSRLGLPVPDGFVITTAAYDYFMGKSRLQEEINRRLQSLEPSDMAGIHETSSEIQKLIINAPFPPELEEAIVTAYRTLSQRAGSDIRVSLRSSALGEDAHEASFAGQYRSLLNVSRDFLILSYKEIAASKYSVPAIAYRLNKGFLDEDIVMGVGCMAMVQADTAGVMYSADPGGGNAPGVVINAVPGLGKSVVDGSMIPDLFVIDPRPPARIIKKEIQEKTKKFVCDPDEGVCQEIVTDAERIQPAIRDDQALALAEMAKRLEGHFGTPQDIEWAIEPGGTILVLQSRPLLILGKEPFKKTNGLDFFDQNYPLVLEGGITASPGAACGPVFRVENTVDMLQFPYGGVLVARNPLPQWAALLSTAVAVVTDQGALTGHLAAVAREFKVPALMGLQKAFQTLKPHDLITVDASHQKIY
ncbi:MAG: PEP/pyruvate-binding domain-containing protein, partial [Thermodesulfobacteriota bacterium]